MVATSSQPFRVVEACAGAGGQSLGLHRAGFLHALAIELDETAAATLADNLGAPVAVGDVADLSVWDPAEYEGIDLFAGGVPCPPFSVAGQQLGSADERDLFAWAVEQVEVIKPRALMLENVRGLAGPRFAAYRQRVMDRLSELGYVGEWKLLNSSDFGVPQLRPRFVLVAMKPEDFRHFRWPEPQSASTTVGQALLPYMAANGWTFAKEWARSADSVGPTLVGGSKKHGGADLGPTRAKVAWARLGIDGRGITDLAPSADAPAATEVMPRLTIEMAARLQGWTKHDKWKFAGRKTAQYRQIGNAFPPPVAEAIGLQIRAAFERVGEPRTGPLGSEGIHDPVYRALSAASRPLTFADLLAAEQALDHSVVERKIAEIQKDFELEVTHSETGETLYQLGAFRGFVGQADHARTAYLKTRRNRVS